MKTNSKSITLFLIFVMLSYIACNDNQKEIKEINTTKTFTLDTLKSSAIWKRYLEQGKTKSKIKLFGKMADVTINGLKLNTEGKIELKSGEMTNLNDSLTNGGVSFNLNLISANDGNASQNQKFLKIKELPKSEFKMVILKEDSSLYNLTNSLAIGDTIKEISTIAIVDFINDSSLQIKGDVKINTLEWPIRYDENKKSVIKDEITIEMDLFFELKKMEVDTIFVEE